MKSIFDLFLLMVLSFLLLIACQPNDPMHDHQHDHPTDGHSHGDHSHHADGHHGPEPLAFVIRSPFTELFVEFPPPIVGEHTPIALHLTDMKNFKPIRESQVQATLWQGKERGPTEETSLPTSPGIFRLEIHWAKSGMSDLEFVINTSSGSDTLWARGIPVYPDQQEVDRSHPKQVDSDDISFSKEQAWKVDFGVAEVRRQSIHEVIRTSGEIRPMLGEEKWVSAKSSGILFFRNRQLQAGKEVRSGNALFTITSQGLVNANMRERFEVAKTTLEQRVSDFKRAEKLLKAEIIGIKDYESRQAALKVAEAEFQTLAQAYNTSGQSVVAPMSGIVKEVMVSDGQFVEEGAPLLRLTNTRRLILKAEVSQQYLPMLSSIQNAHFKAPYHDEVQSIQDYNGRVVSYAKLMEEGSHFLPILFELDNIGNLIPGSFVELFLIGRPMQDALVIPSAALLQDYGSDYVYVQTGGERFEKRTLTLGIQDGLITQVVDGLEEGEWIVTEGAYQIKMASMSSAIPAHGHTH